MAKGTVNKAIILGRLGQDPDVRTTNSGNQVVNLSIATTEIGQADAQGKRQEQTEWHRVTIFGKMADNAAQYLSKGSQVYIEGRLRTRKWTDQQGIEKYTTEIIGYEMQFIGGRSDNQQSTQQTQQQPRAQQQPVKNQPKKPIYQQPHGGFAGQQAQQQPAQPPASNFDDFDDDIPF